MYSTVKRAVLMKGEQECGLSVTKNVSNMAVAHHHAHPSLKPTILWKFRKNTF